MREYFISQSDISKCNDARMFIAIWSAMIDAGVELNAPKKLLLTSEKDVPLPKAPAEWWWEKQRNGIVIRQWAA